MAILRPGPIAAAISGSIAGTTFAHTKNGTIARGRLRRPRQRSQQHQTILNTYSALRTAWRALTANQQAAWRAAALTLPRANVLGISTLISGYNLFVRTNAEGKPLIDPAGTIPQFPDPPNFGLSSDTRVVNLVMSLSAQYTVDLDPNNLALVFSLEIAAARTFRPYRTAAPTHYRRIVHIDPAQSGAAFKSQFDDILGTPELGEFVFVRAQFHRTKNPPPAPTTLSAFVTA